MKPVYFVLAIAAFAVWHLATSPKITEETEEMFKNFVATYRKSYATTEAYGFRLGVFNENLQEIERLSAEHPEAKFAINELADMTIEERAEMMGFHGESKTGLRASEDYQISPRLRGKIPSRKDFTDKQTKVKNQGSCGSCWSFAGVEQLENGYATYKNLAEPIELSPQQFVDCAKGDGYDSDGCNGGWMDDVFKHA